MVCKEKIYSSFNYKSPISPGPSGFSVLGYYGNSTEQNIAQMDFVQCTLSADQGRMKMKMTKISNNKNIKKKGLCFFIHGTYQHTSYLRNPFSPSYKNYKNQAFTDPHKMLPFS